MKNGSMVMLALAGALQVASASLTVYNTGVDQNGNPLAPGAVDPHWSIVAAPNPPVTGVPASAIVVQNAPGAWIRDDATVNAQWISFSSSGYSGNTIGYYQYQTTFNLPNNVDLNSVRLSGRWSSDNDGYRGIAVNNGAFSQNTSGERVYTSFHTFSISSGFVYGQNTLTFEIWDGYPPVGGPSAGGAYTGLIVDDLQLTAAQLSVPVVPEPGTLYSGAGLLGIILFSGASAWRRRKVN